MFMYIEDHMNPDRGHDAYSITEYYMDRETRGEELIFSMLYRQTPEIYDLFDLKLDEESIYRLLNGVIYWRNKELAAHIYRPDSDEFEWIDLLSIADKQLVETLLSRKVLPATVPINNILARVSQETVCEMVEDYKMTNRIYNYIQYLEFTVHALLDWPTKLAKCSINLGIQADVLPVISEKSLIPYLDAVENEEEFVQYIEYNRIIERMMKNQAPWQILIERYPQLKARHNRDR